MDSWTKPKCHYIVVCTQVLCLDKCWGSHQKQVLKIHDCSVCSMHHLGHDGCKRYHPHNITCVSNVLTYLLVCTQPSSYRSGSASHDFYLYSCMHCARCALNEVPALFKPYKVLVITPYLLRLSPNSDLVLSISFLCRVPSHVT